MRSEGRVGGAPKKGSSWASIVNARSDDDVIVGNGAAVAVSEGFSSDQKGSKLDLVRSESRKREDPKNGSSWSSYVDASSEEDEDAGKSISSDTAVADKVNPAISSVAGKAWSADVAGLVVRKMGPTRAWVHQL